MESYPWLYFRMDERYPHEIGATHTVVGYHMSDENDRSTGVVVDHV